MASKKSISIYSSLLLLTLTLGAFVPVTSFADDGIATNDAGVVGSAGTSGTVGVGVVGVATPVFESLLRAKSPSLGAVEGPVVARSVVGCVRTASFVAIPSSAKEVTGTKAPRVRVSTSKLL